MTTANTTETFAQYVARLDRTIAWLLESNGRWLLVRQSEREQR